MRSFLFLTGFLLAAFAAAPAQINDSLQNPRQIAQERVREQQKQQSDINNKLKESAGSVKNESGQNVIFNRRSSSPFKMTTTREQRKRLAPDGQLFSQYAVFLSQPKTGLFKIFPDVGCEENANILRADAECMNWIPNSAFYSFREKEHTSDFLSDISYKNNLLITNGILSQGILTSLGDFPLENVSLSSDGMKFLVDYQPALPSKEAYNQFIQITRGVKIGKFEYRKALPLKENVTYAARIIAYKGKYVIPFRGQLYDVLEGDKRLDLIVALRLAAKNDDGSVTLLWKELDRKEAPRVIFPKKHDKGNNKPTKFQG